MLHPKTRYRVPLALAAALLLVAGIAVALHARGRTERLGLFTTLPILWAEASTVRDMLHDEAPPHWAKAALTAKAALEPLDALSDGAGRSRLDGLDLLVMAQPRPLSPSENVALDRWVRHGGHLLLFADPMLTGESRFALGDKRRPQDVVLLSPILHRWGLTLQVDETHAQGAFFIAVLGVQIPVNLPGTLAISADAKGCASLGDGLVAQCRIGAGKVLVIADAAVLEADSEPDVASRRAVLERLLTQLD